MALLLKKSTLYYRESTSDPWTPFVMSADANFVDFADEYSSSSTYTVGEYCRYDGDFWRCTTAISTAEAWNSAHWQKTTIGAEFQRYLPLTAGLNKPITGELSIKSSYTDGTAPSSETVGNRLLFLDSNGSRVGNVNVAFETDGSEGLVLTSRRYAGSTYKIANLALFIKSDGTEKVVMSGPAAWRSALGLGTSGALPITIAQGGSGQTGVVTESTVSNVISAGSGFTISSVSYKQWGKFVQLHISAKATSAQSTGALVTVGTIVSGKRPAIASAVNYANITSLNYGSINSSGVVSIYGTWGANKEIPLMATYILP